MHPKISGQSYLGFIIKQDIHVYGTSQANYEKSFHTFTLEGSNNPSGIFNRSAPKSQLYPLGNS